MEISKEPRGAHIQNSKSLENRRTTRTTRTITPEHTRSPIENPLENRRTTRTTRAITLHIYKIEEPRAPSLSTSKKIEEPREPREPSPKHTEKIQEPREPLETQSRTNARTDSQSTNIGESKNHENHENHHPRASRRTIQNPKTLKNRRTTRTTRTTEHATHLKIEEPGGPRTHHRADTQLQMPKHRTVTMSTRCLIWCRYRTFFSQFLANVRNSVRSMNQLFSCKATNFVLGNETIVLDPLPNIYTNRGTRSHGDGFPV